MWYFDGNPPPSDYAEISVLDRLEIVSVNGLSAEQFKFYHRKYILPLGNHTITYKIFGIQTRENLRTTYTPDAIFTAQISLEEGGKYNFNADWSSEGQKVTEVRLVIKKLEE